jgi:RNA polymerase sigma factor (sigma-70 family)
LRMSRKGASIDAIERVYRERGAALFRFAYARLGDTELAREAVQEGFARALRGREGFRGSGSLEGWITRCVLNATLDLGTAPRDVQLPEEETGAASSNGLPDPHVRKALRMLPPRQRDALFLRFYMDFDYAMIADALAIEVGTVSATLHAARERLARALEEVAR